MRLTQNFKHINFTNQKFQIFINAFWYEFSHSQISDFDLFCSHKFWVCAHHMSEILIFINVYITTLKEVQPILTFATVAKNSNWRPQWKSMRTEIFNDVEELGRLVCKIILHKYTWLRINSSDVLVFTIYLGMDQIFTDYSTGSKQMACIFCHFWHFSFLPVG